MEFYIVLVLVVLVLGVGVIILFFASGNIYNHLHVTQRELNEFKSRTLYEESCAIMRLRNLEEENKLLKEYLQIELCDIPSKKQFKLKG